MRRQRAASWWPSCLVMGLAILCTETLPSAAEIAGLPDLPVPHSLGKLPGTPIALSPDGGRLAVVRDKKTVLVLRTADAQKECELAGHADAVHGIAFSPDGRHAATASYDDTTRLWDLTTGNQVKVLGKAGKDFDQIAYSPDGRLVAATCDELNLWVWSAPSWEVKKLPCGTQKYQWQVAFLPDGQALLSCGGGLLIFWDVSALTQRRKLPTKEKCISLSPRGDLMATYGGETEAIVLRRITDGEVVRQLTAHSKAASEASFAPSGKFLASCCAEETEAVVWNVETGAVDLRLPHDEKVTWLAFLPDGKGLLTYSDELRVWDTGVLKDEKKRAAFTAFYDGRSDHYARFIRMFLADKDAPRKPLPYLGPKAGRVLVGITNRHGRTIEAVKASIADNSVNSELPMRIGAATFRVEPKKLRAIEVGRIEGKTAHVTLTLLDGTRQGATMAAGPVKGRCTFGDITYELGDVARITFDCRFADQKAEERPEPKDTPFRAEVVDTSGAKFSASELKVSPSRGGATTKLPVYIDAVRVDIDLRYLRKVDTLLAPPGGIIVRVLLLGEHDLIGFIDRSDTSGISGAMGFGKFSLDLGKIKAIQFR